MIVFIGSDLTAAPTGNIKLTAGKLLNLYAVEDVNESSTDVKKRSSFLGIRYNKDNTNDTRQELSQLPAKLIGGKAYTASGGSTLLQGTVFSTLKPADIKVGVGKYADSAATVILAPITNQINTTHNQDRESTVWMKTVDQGSVVTTAALPKFNHVPTITSPSGVIVAVPVEVTVDANNKAKTDIQKSSAELGKIALDLSKQPGYEYLATLDKTNDINWVQVDLIQKNWDYTQEGLTSGAAALIAIAIAVAAGPAGTGLSASMVATNAAGIALQTQAAITLINNKGDISKTLKDMASSDTVRNMATAALTAGLTAKLNIPTMSTNEFTNKLVNGVAEGTTKAFVDSAINGVSLEDALNNSLRNSLVDVIAADTFGKFVKDIDADDFASSLAHKLVAAGVGCVSASAKNQSCDAGAVGAAVGEIVADYIIEPGEEQGTLAEQQHIIDTSKLIAGTVALLAGVDVNTAANSAEMAVKYNGADFAESNRRHEAALQQRVAELKRNGFTNFKYDVRIVVPLPDGSTGIRIIDIVAMKPGQDLTTGRYEEIKSTISDNGVRRVQRRTDPRRVIDMTAKASRGLQASNQVIKDYYLNENGATIQSTGQKIKPGSQKMHWSVWKFTNRTDKSGTKIGAVIPIESPKLNTKLVSNYLF